MAKSQVLKIPAPHDGIDLASPPESMSPTRAPWMENFLVGNYGRLPVRGPAIPIFTDTSANKLNDPMSVIVDPVTTTTYVTRAGNAGTGGNVRPDEIGYRTAAAKANLDTGATQNTSGAAPLASTFFGMGAYVGRTVWGFEYHSALAKDTQDAPILNGPRQWKRRLTKLTNGVLTSYTEAQAPSCGVDSEVHNNLLWVLGGYPAAVTTEEWSSSCLFWTGTDLKADGSLLNGTDVDWRRPSSSVINRIDIPGDDRGKAIVRLGQNLVIFKERSIWVLYGSDDDSYTLRNVTADVGLYDAHSLVEADGGIYFRSNRGFEFFDGTAVANLSDTIQPLFDDSILTSFYNRRCTAGRISDNYIEMRMENVPFNPFVIMALHRPTRNWTSFNGTDGFQARAMYRRAGMHFAELDKTYTAAILDAIANSYISNAVYERVNARVLYRAVAPGGRMNRAQLHRAMLDTKTVMASVGQDTTAPNVWRWTAQGSTDIAYDNGFGTREFWVEQIKAQGATLPDNTNGINKTSFFQGRRTVADVYEEVDDVFFVVEYTKQTNVIRAEIRGGNLEWAPAAPTHTTQLGEANPR